MLTIRNQCWHSFRLVSIRKYFSYCLCLLLIYFPFCPEARFFPMKNLLFFPRWLFCLANFWGPLNNLEGNLDKKQNRSWISCMKQFLNSFKKTKEIFQRSSKWGSRTFGADVTLWYVTANEWQCKMSIFTTKCKQICFLLFLGLCFSPCFILLHVLIAFQQLGWLWVLN